MSQGERLIIVPVPSLVATLLGAETDKGAPLTELEVLAIRDGAPSVALSEKLAAEVIAKRGYDDIDADNVWQAWQAIRPSLTDGGPDTT
jgi:hypothetical protein